MNKMRLTLTGFILLVFLLVPTGCERKDGSQKRTSQSHAIQIQANAFRETPMLGAASEYPFYTILLRLSNRDKYPFVFDRMVVAWDPGSGKVLTGVSTPGNSGGVFTIGPGETRDYWESSGDRTISLLRDAGGKPLRFEVRLLRNGNVVLGPLRTALPDLASLKDTHADGKTAGTPLTFSEDKP